MYLVFLISRIYRYICSALPLLDNAANQLSEPLCPLLLFPRIQCDLWLATVLTSNNSSYLLMHHASHTRNQTSLDYYHLSNKAEKRKKKKTHTCFVDSSPVITLV